MKITFTRTRGEYAEGSTHDIDTKGANSFLRAGHAVAVVGAKAVEAPPKNKAIKKKTTKRKTKKA